MSVVRRLHGLGLELLIIEVVSSYDELLEVFVCAICMLLLSAQAYGLVRSFCSFSKLIRLMSYLYTYSIVFAFDILCSSLPMLHTSSCSK